MYFKWQIAVLLALLALTACNGNKTEKSAEAVVDSLPPDETNWRGVVELQPSQTTDTVTWNGKIYQYHIAREADPSLPQVKDEASGDTFLDNHLDLLVSLDGQEIFHKRFFKTTFEQYIDKDFRQNGMLEGLVFDMVTPQGLRFATSICYPRSDLYIPLVVTIDASGQMTIERDEILDAEDMEQL